MRSQPRPWLWLSVTFLIGIAVFFLNAGTRQIQAACNFYSSSGECSGRINSCQKAGNCTIDCSACPPPNQYSGSCPLGVIYCGDQPADCSCGGAPPPTCTGTCSGGTTCSECGSYSSANCSGCNGRPGGVTADYECCTQANRVAADSCSQGCDWDYGAYTGNNCSGAARWCNFVTTCGSRTDQSSCQGTAGCTWTPLDPYACSTACSAPCGGGTCNNACGEQISCNIQPCCNPAAPTAPAITTPSNGAQYQNLQTTISWSAPSSWGTSCVGGSNTYELFCDPSNPSPTTSRYAGTNTSYVYSGLSYSTTYYCKVRAGNGQLSTDSPVSSFTTRSPAYFQTFGGNVFSKGTIENAYLPAGKYISGK